MEESQLIQAVKQGEKDAFNRLMQPYIQKAYRTAYLIVNDKGLAEDAVDQKAQLVNRSTEEAGVKVTIEKLSISPISFILDYKLEFSEAATNIWGEPYVDITIKDDLGNNYIGEGDGGVGEPSSYMKLSKTFGKINDNATKLIVTPHVRTSNSYGAGYSPLFQPSGGYAQLGEIVIELEK
ncbi:hypothetical protein BAMA_18790 [Bacillus manliponensis]|uniref:DUF5643 domain-containing protein n=1 Tax=Bacillus manliponensis TaxID=574376 RepID=A0A073KC10_9BACI|nr:DUF5643 domain-containing protein [Bacillus manliponensis]KEK19828.1 hypothetical protein BAMA_18790 [Bacillus manliponensis]